MKKRSKHIRKISFITLFTLQSIILSVLIYEYYHSPLPFLSKQQDVEQTQEEEYDETFAYAQDTWTRRDIMRKKKRSIDVSLEADEPVKKDVLQDLYLETDFDDLDMDPFEKELRDTYIYQLPKKNLTYINELMMRADLCDASWSQEVTEFIEVLDKQNAYWLTHGDAEVNELAVIQDNVSTALKAMQEETDASTIDLVKRCYKDYESYYFDKFDWGNEV